MEQKLKDDRQKREIQARADRQREQREREPFFAQEAGAR